MSQSTLTIGILADLLTAAFAVYVGMRVQEARRSGLALGRTLWFWYGMTGFLLLDGGYALAVLYLDIPRPIPVVVLLLRRLLFLVGTAALVQYLVAWSGRAWNLWVLVYYTALITWVEALSLYQEPIGHVQLVWSIQFVYARQSSQLVDFATGVMIFAPLALAALLALGRYRKQHTSGQRFRLAVFCLSILSFCIGVVIGFWDNDWFWYGLFENRLAFSVAAGMLFALRPPWLVRKYWGIARVRRADQWPA